MTIKIEVWQNYGKATGKCEDKFEFCCWQDLYVWLKSFVHNDDNGLNRCEKCKEK